MNKVIIFGIQVFAGLSYYFLKNDSDHKVVAFLLNKSYLSENLEFNGSAVVLF